MNKFASVIELAYESASKENEIKSPELSIDSAVNLGP